MKKQKPPRTVNEIVADLRTKGELDEEKWKIFKTKSLQVKGLVVIAFVIGTAICIFYDLRIIAIFLPIIAVILLIMQYRDELFKVICMNLVPPLNVRVISRKDEINISAGGIAQAIRYEYELGNKKYTSIRSIPSFLLKGDIQLMVVCNPYNPRKHILIVPQQKNNIHVYSLRRNIKNKLNTEIE